MTKVTPKRFIERFFRIRTKDGQLVNLTFNHAQNRLYDLIQENYGNRSGRYIVLKARQLGISTFTEALLTYYTISQHNTDSLIVAHSTEASTSIYNMTRLYISELLNQNFSLDQKYSNAKLLSFDNDNGTGLKSSIRVGTANDSMRGQTFRYVHLSEVAFWEHPNEAMLSIMQCVPNDNNTIVIVESTANGFNYFYDLWQRASKGESDFIPVFFPWYLEDGYVRNYDGFKLTSYEQEIKDKYNLSLEQLSWRRWCIQNNCNGDEYLFKQEYPVSPEEAFITSGTSIFNTESILSRIKALNEPIKRGYFKYDYDGLRILNQAWVDDDKGCISIYEEPNQDYSVLGGDTAGGGADYFACHVLSRDGRQLATLHEKMDEDLFVRQVYCLANHYKSLVSIESNFSSYPNMELRRLDYPYLYVRQVYDSMTNAYQQHFGFRTTSLTRPTILANLVEVMREHIDYIQDKSTLQEALTFIRINGKAQASDGTHDDLIMSLAIAYDALSQIPTNKVTKKSRDPDLDFYGYGG